MSQKLNRLIGSQTQILINQLTASDCEDGCVGIHSPPLALRKSAKERELPAKYDGFIIGPLRQLSAILENKFLGKVYREHSSQMCV